MLPLVLLVAVIIGRWWLIPIAAVAWPIVVSLGGDCSGIGCVLGAAGLGALNAAVGVLVHQGALWLFRAPRRGHVARSK